MDTWEKICRSIRRIQQTHRIYEDVIPRKISRPQVVSVWINSRYNKEDGHSGKKHFAEAEVFILIFEIKISKSPCHISKPEQVRNDKVFTEWDIVIKCHMNDVKMRCDCLLKIAEPWQINEEVQKQKRMLIFIEEGV